MADARPAKQGELVMGEDWTASEDSVEQELKSKREKRNFISLNRSPLARKIITFNLLALIVLVAGVLFLNPFRDSLVAQREMALVSEAQLIADVFEAKLEGAEAPVLADPAATLRNLDIAPGVDVYVFSPNENLMASMLGSERPPLPGTENFDADGRGTVITGFLNRVWESISAAFGSSQDQTPNVTGEDEARKLLTEASAGGTQVRTGQDGVGGSIFSVATPIEMDGQIIGVIALSTVAGQIDQLVRSEREQVLQMFVIAILVSIGLSLVLASTIPIHSQTWPQQRNLGAIRTRARSARVVCGSQT